MHTALQGQAAHTQHEGSEGGDADAGEGSSVHARRSLRCCDAGLPINTPRSSTSSIRRARDPMMSTPSPNLLAAQASLCTPIGDVNSASTSLKNLVLQTSLEMFCRVV